MFTSFRLLYIVHDDAPGSLQLFVGSLGAEPLAAAAIGTTWFNLSFYFLLGKLHQHVVFVRPCT